MKKLFQIICSIFVVATCFMSSAHAIEPRYAGCPMGGKHPMEIVATVTMHEGTYQNPGDTIGQGVFYKCKQCGLGLVCQYQPTTYGCLGAYLFVNTVYWTGGIFAHSYGVDGYEWDYPRGYMWDGMDWLD